MNFLNLKRGELLLNIKVRIKNIISYLSEFLDVNFNNVDLVNTNLY